MAAPPGFHSSILRSPPFICSDLARPVLCLCLCLSTWYGMEFRCSSGRSLLFRAEAGCVALAFLGSWVLAFLHAVGPGDPLVDTALLPDADADADARRAARCLSRERRRRLGSSETSEARRLRGIGGVEARTIRRRCRERLARCAHVRLVLCPTGRGRFFGLVSKLCRPADCLRSPAASKHTPAVWTHPPRRTRTRGWRCWSSSGRKFGLATPGSRCDASDADSCQCQHQDTRAPDAVRLVCSIIPRHGERCSPTYQDHNLPALRAVVTSMPCCVAPTCIIRLYRVVQLSDARSAPGTL